MIGLLSPLSLMLLCWTLTGLIGGYTLAHLDQLELVQIFLRREGLDLGAFSIMGMVWIGIGMLSYIVGDLAARITLPPPRCARIDLDLNRAAQLTFAINLFLLGVTAMWIATSAAQKGGLIQLAAAVYVDNLTTRDLLLENKLFTGMRLFYAALPATGCLAAAILCARRLRRQSRRLCQITIALNIAALFILPIVMSQRLLLLQLVLAAYLAACLAKGRIFGLPWLSVGVVLFLTLWLAREAVTNPFHDGSTTGLAFQKLAFYVVNDLWNSFAPISQPIPHTYGKLTFEGVMFLTFTDSYFLSTLAPKMELLDTVLGGGEFPFFTSAFVDFGPAIGALLIALFGFVFRLVFFKARRSVGWAAIYAQIGAALLFSSHSVYVTHQNFLFSIALIAVIARLSRARPLSQAAQVQEPAIFTSCRLPVRKMQPLPDEIMRNLAIFSTRRMRKRKGGVAHEAA